MGKCNDIIQCTRGIKGYISAPISLKFEKMTKRQKTAMRKLLWDIATQPLAVILHFDYTLHPL
jgi:hypothetical protein